MDAKILNEDSSSITIQITIPFSDGMLDMEEAI
jgi:hypothetical protein